MTTHSNILAWRIPRTKESGRLESMGLQRIGYDGVTKTHTHTSFTSAMKKKKTKLIETKVVARTWGRRK